MGNIFLYTVGLQSLEGCRHRGSALKDDTKVVRSGETSSERRENTDGNGLHQSSENQTPRISVAFATELVDPE